jgi:hypothetical protein
LTNSRLLTITSRQDDGDFAFRPSVSQITPGLSTPAFAWLEMLDQADLAQRRAHDADDREPVMTFHKG